jgi:hypothetical protein
MSEPEFNAVLTHSTVYRNGAENTQTQALSAVLFMYKEVLGADLDYVSGFKRADKPRKLSVVFSPDEAKAVLSHLERHHHLMASLMLWRHTKLAHIISGYQGFINAMNGRGFNLPYTRNVSVFSRDYPLAGKLIALKLKKFRR